MRHQLFDKMEHVAMTASQQKRRPLSRYLKDFKHSQCDCSHCGKSLDRMSLVFRGKILDRETLAGMDQLIDDRVWQGLEKELTALCRFVVTCTAIAKRITSIFLSLNNICLNRRK